MRLADMATMDEVFEELAATAEHYSKVGERYPPGDRLVNRREDVGGGGREPGRVRVR